jgi:hypothetical protein
MVFSTVDINNYNELTITISRIRYPSRLDANIKSIETNEEPGIVLDEIDGRFL